MAEKKEQSDKQAQEDGRGRRGEMMTVGNAPGFGHRVFSQTPGLAGPTGRTDVVHISRLID